MLDLTQDSGVEPSCKHMKKYQAYLERVLVNFDTEPTLEEAPGRSEGNDWKMALYNSEEGCTWAKNATDPLHFGWNQCHQYPVLYCGMCRMLMVAATLGKSE